MRMMIVISTLLFFQFLAENVCIVLLLYIPSDVNGRKKIVQLAGQPVLYCIQHAMF